MFRSWATLLPADVELAVVQLPGRESRWREPAFEEMTQLAPALAGALQQDLDRPFAFFGHSLGALVAFEVARRFRAEGRPLPRVFFASAHRAPQMPLRQARISALSDAQFVSEVNNRHGGVPAEVASNRELMELMVPSLRADYRVFESYRYQDDLPLSCPLIAMGGTRDEHITPGELEGWSSQTSGPFERKLFDGGHFYVNDLRPQVVASIGRELAGVMV